MTESDTQEPNLDPADGPQKIEHAAEPDVVVNFSTDSFDAERSPFDARAWKRALAEALAAVRVKKKKL